MKAYKSLYPLVFLLFVLSISSCHRKTIPASSGSEGKTHSNGQIDLRNMENDILVYVNEHRRAVGLHDLQMLNVASVEAAKHSADMATRRVPFGHSGFQNRVSIISRSLGSVSAAAENVADGKLTARQVVDGWLHSPGHKKNMEGNYSLTGIGIATDAGGVIYFTQIFVRK
ncbi:MAG TPA: CAP domain-containing protein [Chitinophagaceae bacterium]|nr:CAP domain-containing protein [Chitinophagaceae bacterium]